MRLLILQSKRGEGYMDVAVIVLAMMLCIGLAIQVFPVFITQQKLNTFAHELVREAVITGRVGLETTIRSQDLRQQTGLSPTVTWSRTGNIPINQEVSVTLKTTVNIGLFGGFGSFPIALSASAKGKSEVYWK